MVKQVFTIVDLIAHADSEDQIEGLLDVLIEEATFEDVENIRTVLNDKLNGETISKAKYNYKKAIELLD
jgi:hypothetical protein